MTIEETGVKGELQLKQRWYETSSTHYEETDTIILRASCDGKKVIFEEKHDELDVYKPKKPVEINRYIIDPQELIELIKEHGIKE